MVLKKMIPQPTPARIFLLRLALSTISETPTKTTARLAASATRTKRSGPKSALAFCTPVFHETLHSMNFAMGSPVLIQTGGKYTPFAATKSSPAHHKPSADGAAVGGNGGGLGLGFGFIVVVEISTSDNLGCDVDDGSSHVHLSEFFQHCFRFGSPIWNIIERFPFQSGFIFWRQLVIHRTCNGQFRHRFPEPNQLAEFACSEGNTGSVDFLLQGNHPIFARPAFPGNFPV